MVVVMMVMVMMVFACMSMPACAGVCRACFLGFPSIQTMHVAKFTVWPGLAFECRFLYAGKVLMCICFHQRQFIFFQRQFILCSSADIFGSPFLLHRGGFPEGSLAPLFSCLLFFSCFLDGLRKGHDCYWSHCARSEGGPAEQRQAP